MKKRRNLRTFREFQKLQTDFNGLAGSEDERFNHERRFEKYLSAQQASNANTTSKPRGIVKLGSIVLIQREGAAPEEYTIVRPEEADERLALISEKSRIGRAILGYSAGDFVKVPSADGVVRYCILKVK